MIGAFIAPERERGKKVLTFHLHVKHKCPWLIYPEQDPSHPELPRGRFSTAHRVRPEPLLPKDLAQRSLKRELPMEEIIICTCENKAKRREKRKILQSHHPDLNNGLSDLFPRPLFLS